MTKNELLEQGYKSIGIYDNIEFLCKQSDEYPDKIVYRTVGLNGFELQRGNRIHIDIEDIERFVKMKQVLGL
ncbi:hypothetical protein ACFYU8_18555 [Brevibacillus sp. NPDC003359]|uniref:hypothetical protein n=1 Tax=unclassified Brevibacillus TaxID=2684853 RepID=UPI0036A20162